MTCDNLLLKVKSRPTYEGHAVALAQKSLTEDQANALERKLQTRLAAIKGWTVGYSVVWACATGALLVSRWSQTNSSISFTSTANMVLALLACVMMGLLAFMPLGSMWDRTQAKLSLLAPIPGTDYCNDAMAFLRNGSAEVEAWRDIALAERNVLRVYDVKVMRALNDYAEDASRARHEAVDRENACRWVHGVSSPK